MTPFGATLALNRFGLGARPEFVDPGFARDPRGAVIDEVKSGGPVASDRVALLSSADLLKDLAAHRSQRARPSGMAPATAPEGQAAMTEGAMSDGAVASRPIARMLGPELLKVETTARFDLAFDAPVGLVERLVWFWSNHFCVSRLKGDTVSTIAGAYEREAIRPNVLGRFADMLIAVEQHPAMLHYLDNVKSIGPNSRAGMKRSRGLNENLAREILELHTLGVNGGYSPADIVNFARILTGWTRDEQGRFFFNDGRHEPGAFSVLGRSYGQPGVEKGEAALLDLARHDATAQHIARKLVGHFVSDDPPAALVARVAGRFKETDGDLRETTLSLVESDEAWAPVRAKVKQPQEFLISSFRAVGRRPRYSQMLNSLKRLGQPLWSPTGPNGFPDTAADWANGEGLRARMAISQQIAAHSSDLNPADILDATLGQLASKETRRAVADAASASQGLALILLSPEFQRR